VPFSLYDILTVSVAVTLQLCWNLGRI